MKSIKNNKKVKKDDDKIKDERNVKKTNATKKENDIDLHTYNEKKGFHFSLVRVILLIVLFITFFGSCLFFASKTIEREKLLPLPYSQKGTIDYKVFLNKNEFYEQDYLDMNKAYIASLIKNITTDFIYSFHIDKNATIDFEYSILADLVIENSEGNKKYFEKTYTLLDTQKKEMYDNREISIKEKIKIDYNYYNNLANTFRSTYGVGTNSYLNVYLKINASSIKDDSININETNQFNLRIPLSEKSIEIKLDSNSGEITKYVIPEGKVIFSSKYLIIEIVLFIISAFLFAKLMRKLSVFYKTTTPFDQYVNKILKEYDRLIVEINNIIDLNKYNVIKVNNFNELLDVRDNLKVPILYLCVTKHEKGIFYIKNNDDVYLLTIKNVDLM